MLKRWSTLGCSLVAFSLSIGSLFSFLFIVPQFSSVLDMSASVQTSAQLLPSFGGSVAANSKRKGRYECAKSCSNRGTCTEELGHCRCPFGFTGKACEDLAMPRCNLSPEYLFPTCNEPTACSCFLECEKFHVPHPNICFNDSKIDGSVETDIVKIYNAPLVIMQTDLQGKEVGQRQPTSADDEKKFPFRNPLECSQKCSGRGACLKGGDSCR